MADAAKASLASVIPNAFLIPHAPVEHRPTHGHSRKVRVHGHLLALWPLAPASVRAAAIHCTKVCQCGMDVAQTSTQKAMADMSERTMAGKRSSPFSSPETWLASLFPLGYSSSCLPLQNVHPCSARRFNSLYRPLILVFFRLFLKCYVVTEDFAILLLKNAALLPLPSTQSLSLSTQHLCFPAPLLAA